MEAACDVTCNSDGHWDGRRLDRAWTALVGHADAVLRQCLGVTEFTADPGCVLRIERCRARSAAVLSDGTRIRRGDPLAGLHFWNEHLPRFPPGGPDLRWAKTMQGQLRLSLRLLAQVVASSPDWRDVRALRGCAPFCSRLCALRIQRVSARYGFELVEAGPSAPSWLHFGEDILIWALARAYNPQANARQPFRRERHEVWISRARLIGRHGETAAAGGDA